MTVDVLATAALDYNRSSDSCEQSLYCKSALFVLKRIGSIRHYLDPSSANWITVTAFCMVFLIKKSRSFDVLLLLLQAV